MVVLEYVMLHDIDSCDEPATQVHGQMRIKASNSSGCYGHSCLQADQQLLTAAPNQGCCLNTDGLHTLIQNRGITN
jgi:hypothetical protein